MGANGRLPQFVSLSIDDAGIADAFARHMTERFGPDAVVRRYGDTGDDATCHQLLCNDAATATAVAERYVLPIGGPGRQARPRGSQEERSPPPFLVGALAHDG